MIADHDGGLLKAASEVGKGALLGGLWGVFYILRPSARGYEMEIILGFSAIGALVFLIRFLLSELSDKGPAWYYIVWSFSFTLASFVALAVEFTRSGYDGDLLLLTMLFAPFGGAWFGYLYRRGTRE